MATRPKVVAVDRPSGTKSLMYGHVRIDVAFKPPYDEISSGRPERSNYCPTHKHKLNAAWFCSEGKGDGHFIPYNQSHKMVDYEGTLIRVDDSELKELQQPSDGVVELQAMVPYLDPAYVEKSWTIWPADQTWARPYKILHGVLAESGGALMGVVINEGMPRILAVRVVELEDEIEVMVMHLCHHAVTVRTPMLKAISDAIKGLDAPSKEEMAMATEFFHTLPSEFPLDGFIDELGQAQWSLVKAKSKGQEYLRKEIQVDNEPPDLIAAMRKTLEDQKNEKKKTKPKASAGKKVK